MRAPGRLPRPVRHLDRKHARRLATFAAAAALPLALGACGDKQAHPTIADGEAEYVDAGPVTYQVQLSRELNPYAVDDKQYLAGVPAGQLTLQPDQEWFVIFVWAKNLSRMPQTTTDSFDIVDTKGNKFDPVPLNPQVNPFAWTSATLQPGGTEPAPDSAPQFSATQGQELLFKLDTKVYDDRPLMLEIHAPGQANPSTVSLDL